MISAKVFSLFKTKKVFGRSTKISNFYESLSGKRKLSWFLGNRVQVMLNYMKFTTHILGHLFLSQTCSLAVSFVNGFIFGVSFITDIPCSC